MRKTLHLVVFFMLLSGCLYSQTTKSSKARQFHERALRYYNASAYDEALEETGKALKADRNFIESWLLSGDIYSLRGEKQKAIDSYKTAISIDSAFFVPAYYILANLLFDQGEYEESLIYYTKYRDYHKIREAEKVRLEKNVRTAHFRINALRNPVPFNPVNLGEDVNTAGYEFVNHISADRQFLYFTRRMTTGDRRDEQFFYSQNSGDTLWVNVRDIGAPINTERDEGAMTVSPDGQYLFFSGCNSPEGFGSCDLYVASNTGNGWGEPVNLGPIVNTGDWESQPSFSSDGKTLYFVSNRAGGHGSSDIWITTLADNGYWTEPVNAGDVINTSEAERGPFIHPDGETLYFSSKGHTGMGQGDLFYSRFDGDVWTEPENLGFPINTSEDEVTLIVDNIGEYAYYSSAKSGGYGLQDIYRFELPQSVKPNRVSYLKGIVYDSITGGRLDARITLLDPQTGDTLVSSNSNAGDGSYLLVLPSGRNYALNCSRPGYLFYSARIELAENNDYIDPYRKDIPLKKIKEGEKIILQNIFFATDSFNLLPDSKAELDNLVKLMTNNPGIRIQISGHTDNTGSEQYNNELSEKRAGSVYTFLIGAGVERNRVSFKGYGSSVPVADNETEEGKALNRRTEMVVTQVH